MNIKFIDDTFDDVVVKIGEEADEIEVWQVGDCIVIPRAEAVAMAEALMAWAEQQTPDDGQQ